MVQSAEDGSQQPQRIMIIGGPGSGKSTAAQKIGAALDLPVFHIDREVFWLPGWVERDRADQVKQVERIVGYDQWVFEGSNSRTLHLREARAEMLIWLDTPLPLRLFRVIRRSLRQRGQVRADMAENCPERLNMLPEFLWFILSTWRPSGRKARAFFDQCALPKHRFTTARAVNRFVATLKDQQATPSA